MYMSLPEALSQLKQYAKMHTEEEAKLFDKILCALPPKIDIQIKEQLIELFDDETEFPEVMYNLVHILEHDWDEEYIKLILGKVVDYEHAPGWFSSLVYHILNDTISLNLFAKNIYLANKESLNKLLEQMYVESKEHREIITKLIDLANHSSNP